MKQISNIKTYGLLAFAACFLFGCDDAKKTIKNLSEQPEMQGKFLSSCERLGVEGMASVSSQDEIYFVGNQVTVNSIYYSDANCNSENEIGRVEYEGDFEVDRKGLEKVAKNYSQLTDAQKKDLDGGFVELDIDKANVKATDQTLVSLLNGISFCGSSDYQLDKAKDITTATSEEIFCPIKSIPARLQGGYVFNEKAKELTFSNYQEPAEAGSDLAKPDQDKKEGSKVSKDDRAEYSVTDVFRDSYKKQQAFKGPIFC